MEYASQQYACDSGVVRSYPRSDLQYVVFTLITVVYFAAPVLAQPAKGLPAVPAALLTLMGVSASGYAAKKVVDTQGSVRSTHCRRRSDVKSSAK